jgi:hypothetical protein
VHLPVAAQISFGTEDAVGKHEGINMREIMKAMTKYTLATSLFGIKQLAIALTVGEPGVQTTSVADSMEALTNATREQLGTALNSTFGLMDGVQGFAIDMAFFAMSSFARLAQDDSRPGLSSSKDVPDFTNFGSRVDSAMEPENWSGGFKPSGH